MGFLGLYRAAYPYTPQAEGELTLQEKDLLCVLEKSEDGWWKVKKKGTDDDEDEPEGLVPGNYCEEASPIANAKVLYDYAKQTDEEVNLVEDISIDIYDTSDESWTLVGINGDFGYAPATYIDLDGKGHQDELEDDEEEAPPPPMPARPSIPIQDDDEPGYEPPPKRATSHSHPGPAAALANVISGRPRSPSPAAPSLPIRKQVQFTSEESDEEVAPSLPRRTAETDDRNALSKPSRQVSIKVPGRDIDYPSPNIGIVSSPPHNRVISTTYDEVRSHDSPGGYHLYNIYEVVEVMGKKRKTQVTLGINIGKGIISISQQGSREAKEWGADKLSNYSSDGKHVFMDLIRPSKSIDFHAGAKDTAREIVSALGELAGAVRDEGLREVIAASSATQKLGKMVFAYSKSANDEVTVLEGDEVIIIKGSPDADWWTVKRRDNGLEGNVPASYVEVIGTINSAAAAVAAIASPKSQKFSVEKNRAEEERLTREASRRKQTEVGPGLRLPDRGSSLSHDKESKRNTSHKSKNSSGKHSMPNATKLRTWTDRSGSFKVEAEFIGLSNGQIHLHKNNGVKIAVPVEKMSLADLEYVERATGHNLDDDKLLADLKKRRSGKDGTGASIQNLPKKVEYDWFDFFLQCGVGHTICQRYASAFSRDEMTEENLPDVSPALLRTLGIKEGDILRIMKFLDNKFGRDGSANNATNESGGLFSGAGGALRDNTKKSRPTPTNPAKDTVDEKAFESKSQVTSPQSSTASPINGKSKSAEGFDDNAWEPREGKAPSSAPAAATKTSSPPPKSVEAKSEISDLVGLSINSPPLKPSPSVNKPTIETPAAEVSVTGASPSLFEQLAKNPGTLISNQPRQRPAAPTQLMSSNSVIQPPPQRAISAPQNPNQGSAFNPPAPLQPQLTGYIVPNMQTMASPPGQSLQSLALQRNMMQQQMYMMPQQTGYAQFNPNMMMPQQLTYQQTGYINGQTIASPFADPQPGFGYQAPYLQAQATGVNSILPPALIPDRTGATNLSFNNGNMPPVPPIPQQQQQQQQQQQPTPAPLIPQKTGPPPPVRFGVSAQKKMVPQPTGKRANLAAATSSNPFGFVE